MVANSSPSTITHESSDHRPLNFSHIKAPFTHYQCQDSSGEDATYETIISQILKTVCPMTSLHSLRVIQYVHKGIYALTKCRSHFNNFLHITQIHSMLNCAFSSITHIHVNIYIHPRIHVQKNNALTEQLLMLLSCQNPIKQRM